MSIQIHVSAVLQWTDEIIRNSANEFGIILGENDTIHGSFPILVDSQGKIDAEYLNLRMDQFATIQPHDSPIGLYAIVKNGQDIQVKKNAMTSLIQNYKHHVPRFRSNSSVLIIVNEANIRHSGTYSEQSELTPPLESYLYSDSSDDILVPIENSIISDVTENASINSISNFPKYSVDNGTAAGDTESTCKQLKRQIDNLAYAVFMLKNNVTKLLQYYDSITSTNNNNNNNNNNNITSNRNKINRLTVQLANKINAFQNQQQNQENQHNTTQLQVLQLSLLTDQVQALRMLQSRIKTLMAQEVITSTR